MGRCPGTYCYAFHAVMPCPAYVEIELTVWETPTLRAYQSLGPNNQATFLANHIGQMHVFKQRVTIPSVDRAAYP